MPPHHNLLRASHLTVCFGAETYSSGVPKLKLQHNLQGGPGFKAQLSGGMVLKHSFLGSHCKICHQDDLERGPKSASSWVMQTLLNPPQFENQSNTRY